VVPVHSGIHVAQRFTRDRGSALVLMPAAVLIVLLLAAITVDMSVVHLGQRQLIDSASAAANDAVTFGLDERALRSGQPLELDRGRVYEAVVRSLDASGILDRLAGPPVVAITGPLTVRVDLDLRVDYVFAHTIPGVPHDATVHATATATAASR
jgi:hypothetical protein